MASISKDESMDSLASLEEKSSPEYDGDLKDMEFPTNIDNIEEVEVEGEGEELQDEWMDIIGSGDLKKKVLVAGIVESRPVKGDTVCCELTMKLSDGSVVEAKHSVTFTLGDCEVIKGLDLVVSLMDRDEQSEVFMASRFAYGEKGEEDKVPPGAELYCTVKLLDFKPEETPDMLSVPDRQLVGNRKRIRGNWWFNRADYSEAVQCYKAAVDFLDDNEEIDFESETRVEVRDLIEERLKALNNMAAAQIKLCAYDAAFVSVNSVLNCQPLNVKALFRKAKVLQHKNKLSEAYDCLRQAIALEPENRTIHAELSKLSGRIREEKESERSLYRRMLGVKKREGEEEQRHLTISSGPWRVFFSSFLCIVFAILLFRYKDDLAILLS